MITAQDIKEEIRAEQDFDANTYPSLATVERWIAEEIAQVQSDKAVTIVATQFTTDIDYTGSDAVVLEHAPIISIDSFLYNQNPLGSEQGTDYITLVEDTHFTVNKRGGVLPFIFRRFNPIVGMKRFRIVYTAGYNPLPSVFKTLVIKKVSMRVLQSVISKSVNDRDEGLSISIGGVSIVEPRNIGVNNFRLLTEDIRELDQKVAHNFAVHRYDYS